MLVSLIQFFTLVSALGCGLIAGVFFAFSTFVMKALASLPPAGGISAMQSINVAVLNPWFLSVFLGTALTSLSLVVSVFARWHRPGATFLLLGAGLYLLGTVLVTMACNVPRNDALASLDPASAAASSLWAEYIVSWTFWNHLRTVAALLAGGAFTIALCLGTR